MTPEINDRNRRRRSAGNFLAFNELAPANEHAVSAGDNYKSGRLLALFSLDVFAVAAFGIAVLASSLAPIDGSMWALGAHATSVAALATSLMHRAFSGRKPLYWSHFDFWVFAYYGWIALTVVYSEIPWMSYRGVTLAADGLIAYVLGRILFFRRLRTFGLTTILLCAAILVVSLGETEKPGFRTGVEPPLALSARLAIFLCVFFLTAQLFLALRKPANVVFAAWIILTLTVGGLWVVNTSISWLDALATTASLTWLHEPWLEGHTLWRIVRTFPVFGCGWAAIGPTFRAFAPSPQIAISPSTPALALLTAETGAVGSVLFILAWFRVPAFALRHWALFPNRRLRMAVLIFLTLVLTICFRAITSGDLFERWFWMLAWAVYGTFVSLVAVRDPVRIFYEHGGGLSAEARNMRLPSVWQQMVHSAFRPESMGSDLSRNAQRLNRLPNLLALLAIIALCTGIFIAQSIPYAAAFLMRRDGADEGTRKDYTTRLEQAVRLFPVFAEGWARLAQHLQQRAGTNVVELFRHASRIEAAYQQAIRWNPYEPSYYEQFSFFNQDTNNQTRALEVLRGGVRNNPNHLVLRLLLVREFERSGSYALATWHLRQALFRISPQQVELFLKMAELYEARGMHRDAVRFYQYAKQVVPETPQIAVRLRRLAERLGVAKRPS